MLRTDLKLIQGDGDGFRGPPTEVAAEDPLTERALLDVVTQAADLIRVVSPDGVIRYASETSRPLLGYRPQELVGRKMSEFHHPDEAAALAQASVEVDRDGSVVRRVHRSRRRDGSYQWLETSGRSVKTDGHAVLVLVSRDATSQVQLGHALTSMRERTDVLLEAMTEPVVMVDAQLRVLAVSPSWARLFGEAGSPVGAQPLWRLCDGLFGPRDRSRLVEAAGTAMATHKPQQVSVRRVDGPLDGFSVSCCPLVVSESDLVEEAVIVFEPEVNEQPSRAALVRYLTPREREVLAGLGEGQDTRMLADSMHISEHTVRGHIKSILQKLQVHSQLQAVLEGMRAGVVPLTTGGYTPRPSGP